MVDFIKDPNRTHEMRDCLERNSDMMRDEQITFEVAKEAASNPSDFERALAFE